MAGRNSDEHAQHFIMAASYSRFLHLWSRAGIRSLSAGEDRGGEARLLL